MEVSGHFTPLPLYFWQKGLLYPFAWGLVSEPTCTLWRTGESWFSCLGLFVYNSFVHFPWTMLHGNGMGNVAEQLPDFRNCCLLLCEMRRRLMFDLLIQRYFYYFNNPFSSSRVTWRLMIGWVWITNGKRRSVLQCIVPADAGRYWGKLNSSHSGRFENWDSHLGAFEYEAGHDSCMF